MIRRDYILRMIEECVRMLARLNSLKQGQRWDEAQEELDADFQRLVGAGPQTVVRLSETELLARLIEGEPTQVVRHKTLVLTTLLKEAGDVAVAQERHEESRACHLKALHLLLDVLAQGEVFECPEFMPKVEMLVAALRSGPLPIVTNAALMQHYERIGEFAKAEDALFAMLDAGPENRAIVEFGVAFYERLRRQSDAALGAGNLPRAEVEAGLEEMRRR